MKRPARKILVIIKTMGSALKQKEMSARRRLQIDVYMMEFEESNKVFIGQTVRELHLTIGEHQSDLRYMTVYMLHKIFKFVYIKTFEK